VYFPEWHEKALCAEIPGDLWFPEVGGSSKETAAAKEVCGRCPVKAMCLEEALLNKEMHGIWGQTTPQERLALRKLRK